ncbi:MAG TPA: Nramp family divalent metal transporter [Thermodesulfobacteriota bacterium]|jgi:manganese transport protein
MELFRKNVDREKYDELEQARVAPKQRWEFLKFLGPAFVASVAYMDPGNFATNIAGGAEFNYKLLWVLLWSNLMAILVQVLSAKLGIATGKSLPQNCRQHFSLPLTYFLWFTAEIVAIATDLAEFLGAALGFYLLLHIPLLPAALLTGLVVFLILAVEKYGFRQLEYVIMGFVGIIGIAYTVEVLLAKPDWSLIAYHVVVPQIDSKSVYVAVGMLGATVMPHVIYLHSALVKHRLKANDVKHSYKHFHFERLDVFLAMNAAWLINSAMIIMSAAVFFRNGIPVQSIEQAHETLTPILGEFSAAAFGIALLCSGLSSSTVGTMAGQVIIEGFLDIKFSIFLRRLITMIPALIVIALGLDPLKILILSQVTLSFGLPFAIIPLIFLTSKKKIMGDLANRKITTGFAILVSTIIIVLNVLLLYQIFGGSF